MLTYQEQRRQEIMTVVRTAMGSAYQLNQAIDRIAIKKK